MSTMCVGMAGVHKNSTTAKFKPDVQKMQPTWIQQKLYMLAAKIKVHPTFLSHHADCHVDQ